jgi:hypothetical protein
VIEPLTRLAMLRAEAQTRSINAMDASLTEAIDQAVSAQPEDITEPAPQKPEPSPQKPIVEMAEHRPKPKLEIDAERIRTSIARLTSNSIGELEGLASELQKLDEFIKFETDRIQHDIDSLLSGIKIIVETIAPWKRQAAVTAAPLGPARTVLAGGRGEVRRHPTSG